MELSLFLHLNSMDSNELKIRTKKFAHRCVALTKAMPNDQLCRILSGQLIRCATSVSANYRAACYAQSKASFISKISIVIEEIDESEHWLIFIRDEGIFSPQKMESIINEAKSLNNIFNATRITARKRMKK